MGRSKKRQTEAEGTVTRGRKRAKLSTVEPSTKVELSQEQLVQITNTVTQNVLSHLQQKSTEETTRAAQQHVRTADLQSPDLEQGSSQVSETSTAANNVLNQTESVIPITIADAANQKHGEGSVIMPATAASLPVPLGIHIDAATKSKIWSNQFVDLSILLSRQTSQSFKIQLEDNQLTMTPKRKPFILNMEQWNQAFTIYMSIYVEKYPDQAVHMLQYIGHIQEMAQMSGENAARHYDQMFRKWRQSTPLPWNVINQSLHAKALAVGLKQKVVPSRKGPAGQQKPCFFFRDKGFCSRESCPFRHFCEQCKAIHPNKVCTLRSGSKAPQDQNKPQTIPKPAPKAPVQSK